MGLFDRFRRKPGEQEKKNQGYFLDADKSSSLGDVDFMRRSNTIRHTFPGTVENPGMKERYEDVASNEARMGKVSDGLPEAGGSGSVRRVDPGVPKPVKKTFAQQISQQELQERMKGAAVSGTNVPGSTGKSPQQPAAPQQTQRSVQKSSKPGSIDPFREMLKDIR